MAKKQPLPTLTSWSYSAYTQYNKCPHSVFLQRIKRVRMPEPDEPNPHLVKGDMVHKFSENYVKQPGRAPVLIPEVKRIAGRLKELRKAKARVEGEWAFNRDWLPVSWFAKDAWIRMKVDALLERLAPPLINIIDYKTGKVYDDHKQQRSLYALGGLQLVQIGQLARGMRHTELIAEHLYTDTGQHAKEVFHLKDLPKLKREWEKRTEQMLRDTDYKPVTGNHCRWCEYRKSNGGPCPENM